MKDESPEVGSIDFKSMRPVKLSHLSEKMFKNVSNIENENAVNFYVYIPDGMNFDPVKCVKETFSRAGYAYRMNFDPPARRHICSGDSQITCLK